VRPAIYDYGAADNLESALRTAATTLEIFVTQRSQTAQHDFGYTVNGIIEGWIGNAYNKWCIDFNTSQNVLTNYVNNLNQLWVQVHNATYDAEMYMYNHASISRLPVPSPVGNPILAPQNSDPNNAEGATPAMLYDYSDLMTGQNDQILPTFRTSLPQYVSDYYANYSSSSNSAEPNLIQPIDELYPDAAVPHSIAYYLTSTVRPMDAHVRTVGKAFEKADSNPVTTSPSYVPRSDQGDPDADHFITLSSEALLDQTIAQIDATDASIAQFTADEKAGSQAAQSFKAGGDLVTQQLLDEIIANQNNAAWTSAFFSTLSTADILRIIQYMNATPGGQGKYLQAFAQACATALDSGLLSPSSVQNLISVVLHDPHQGISVDLFNQYLLDDLKNDPKAAVNFINYATDQQLQQLLNGNYSVPGTSSSQREAQIINLATEALGFSADQSDAESLYQRISKLIMQTQPPDAETVLPAAQKFFGTYIFASTYPPAPDAGPDALTGWAEQVAQNIDGKLKSWLNWIESFESKNLSDQGRRQAIEELVIGFVTTGIGLLLSPLGSAILGASSTVLTSVGVQWVDEEIFPLTGDPVGDTNAFTAAAERATKFLTAVEAVGAGDVIGPDGKVVSLDDSNNVLAVLKDPGAYTLRGSAKYKTVKDLLDNAGNQFSPAPGD
jgi:hypothetical protein